MRVVFVTHYFPPEVGAAQSRISALAAGLAGRGAEVVVHTPPPHYPSGVVAPPHRARGRSRTRAGAVTVVRSPVLPAANAGFARRLTDHLSFCASSLLCAGDAGPADVVVVESPPLFTAAAGVLHARGRRVPMVLNVSDRWPATAVELGALTDPRAVALAEALERWVYRHSAAITTPTAGLVRDLSAVRGAEGKVHRLGPAVDLRRFPDPVPLARAAEGPLRVLYAGTLGMAQGVADLVEGVRLAGPEVAELLVVGDGAEQAEVREAAGRAPNVRVAGAVPAGEVPALYAAADVGAVVLRDRPIFRGALPTKMLEVMAAARPVLLAAHGEAAALVTGAGCGVVVAPESPEAVAAGLRELQAGGRGSLARLGEAGRDAVEARFSLDGFVDGWSALLEDVARSCRDAEVLVHRGG